jgi:hypothetical protein
VTSVVVLVLFVLSPVAGVTALSGAVSSHAPTQGGLAAPSSKAAAVNELSPGPGEAALVQQNDAGFNEFSSPPFSVAFGSNVASGDIVVVGVVLYGSTVSSVTDSLGSSYASAGSRCSGIVCTYIYYATPPSGGPDTVSVTPSYTTEQAAVYVYDVSGVTATGAGAATGVTGTSSGGGTQTFQTSSSVPFQTGAFLLGVVGTIQLVPSPTAGTGFAFSPMTGTQESGVAEYSTGGAASPTDFPGTYVSVNAIAWAEVGIALEPSGTSTTTTTTTTTTTSSSSSSPPGEEQVSITLDQFHDPSLGNLGTPLSVSNYFTVDYTEGGSSQTAEGTGGLLTISADPSTTVTISALSSGSNIFEEWCLSATAGTCEPTTVSVGTSAVSVTYVYFDLQAQVVSYDVSGGGNPVAPFFDYATVPSAPTSSSEASDLTVGAVPISPGHIEVWVLAGAVETFDSVINTNPATSLQRWQGVPTCSYLGSAVGCGSYVAESQIGPFSQGGISVAIEYYLQYSVPVTFELSTDPGTGYSLPTLTYAPYYGGESTLQITCQYGTPCTPASVWINAGSYWSASALLGGSGSAEQWACTSGCSGTVTSPGEEIGPFYAHEFLVTFTAAAYYSCSGSGYPPLSPDNTCIDLGPNISPYGPTWVPAGQPFTVSTDVTKGNALIGWTTCASWTAINDLPGDSGCPGSDVSIPSGLGTATSDGWETQITANGPGDVYADGVFQASGSESTCTGPNCSYVTGTSIGYEGASDPVYVLVTGPSATGQIGCNAEGAAVDTMALSSVSSCGGDAESITIGNPVAGQYEIQVFPDGGNGAFNVTVTSEDSEGDPIGAPLTDSGACTSSGGCSPFFVTEGSAGTISLSSLSQPLNQYVIVACITPQAECNQVGYPALDITFYASSTSAAVAYADTLLGTSQVGLSEPVESVVIYMGAQEVYSS